MISNPTIWFLHATLASGVLEAEGQWCDFFWSPLVCDWCVFHLLKRLVCDWCVFHLPTSSNGLNKAPHAVFTPGSFAQVLTRDFVTLYLFVSVGFHVAVIFKCIKWFEQFL